MSIGIENNLLRDSCACHWWCHFFWSLGSCYKFTWLEITFCWKSVKEAWSQKTWALNWSTVLIKAESIWWWNRGEACKQAWVYCEWYRITICKIGRTSWLTLKLQILCKYTLRIGREINLLRGSCASQCYWYHLWN